MTPDTVLLRYAELASSLGSPRGIDPVAMEGVIHAPRCSRCKGKERVTIAKDGRAAERCKKCGSVWPLKRAVIPKGGTQSGAKHGARALHGPEGPLSELATLARYMADVSVWEMRAWSLYLLGQVSGGMSGVASELEDRFGEPPHPWKSWNRWNVAELIDSARESVRERM